LKVLLCKPEYFDVTEFDRQNKHMDPGKRPNRNRALQSHKQLAEIYSLLGVETLFIEPVPGLIDMTFSANCGLVLGKKVLLSNFRPERRRPESLHYRKYFESLGYEVHHLPEDIYFEGAGDAIPYKNKILLGYGFRTDKKAIPYIEKFSEREVVPLELKHSGKGKKILYHFDTTSVVLEEIETFIACQEAFTKNAFEALKKLGNIFLASYEDGANLALNAVAVPKKEIVIKSAVDPFNEDYNGVVITSSLASRELVGMIEQLNYSVVLIDLKEFLKSGGGAFCLTKIL